jgi:hypothetical protein
MERLMGKSASPAIYSSIIIIIMIITTLLPLLLLLVLQSLVDLNLFQNCHPVSNFRSFSTELFLWGGVVIPMPNPTTWRTRVFLFVWVITFDLSGMGGPTSSYASKII